MQSTFVIHSINHPTMALFRIQFLFIFGVTYLVTTISMKLLISSSVNKNTLNVYKPLKKILNKCYPDNLNPLIMSDVTSQQLKEYSSLEYPISLILIDENFNLDKTEAQWTNYYPNSATIVLIIDSFDQFANTLSIINRSVWGFNKSSFILVSLNCRNGPGALVELWNYKFLSAIFLCYIDQKNIVQLYSFNPFTDRAPYPWIKIGSVKSFTLYKRYWQEDKNMCLNLIYDKTKYFDGYKMTTIGHARPGATTDARIDYNISSLTEKLSHSDAQYNLNIFLLSNITPIIHYNVPKSKNYDYFLGLSRLEQIQRAVYTCYPFRQTSAVIVSQKRPFLSVEEQIQSFYSLSIILLVIISFGTLFIALILNKKQPWMSAVMELMRLLVSTGLLQPLNRLPLRIYLFGIFWLAIILNATFTGKLLEFLTKPQRHNISSIDDLRKFKYQVYLAVGIWSRVNSTLTEMQLSPKITGTYNEFNVVFNDSHSALILIDYLAYELAYRHQLHASYPCSYSYARCIATLPITKRIDEISSRFFESGLQSYWVQWDIYKYQTNLTNSEERDTSPQVRLLTTADLLFMFKFLAIGLGISFVLFSIEVVVGIKYKKRINKRNTVQVNRSLRKSKPTCDEIDVLSL